MIEGQGRGSGQGWGLRSGTRLGSSLGGGQGQEVRGGGHSMGLSIGARGAVGFFGDVEMKRKCS